MSAPQPIAMILDWLFYALIAFKVLALLDAAWRRQDAYIAAGKWNKIVWLLVLGAAVAWDIIFLAGVLKLLSLIGLVAAIVYVVDVRPALREAGGGRGGGNGRHMGPYGPW